MKQLSPVTSILILLATCGLFVGGAVLIYRPQPKEHQAEVPSVGMGGEGREVATVSHAPGGERTGSAACGQCHADILAKYMKHPMYYGSTRPVKDDMFPPGDSEPMRGSSKTLLASSATGKMLHIEYSQDAAGEELYRKEHEMEYVVGSGRRAKAYVEKRGNMLCLSPLNWFGKTMSWGLNPGYSVDDPRGFDRKALANCLLCHTGEIRTQAPLSDLYQPEPFGEMAIGCERCHGVGRSHIEFHERFAAGEAVGVASDPIVNPADLAEAAREAVCYQCHLQPSSARVLREGRAHQDFQPGMRLDDVWLVVDSESGVGADGRTQSVRHVQQMHDSLCFKRSAAMRCTTCHDPHSVPEPDERIAFYRDACNQCHTQEPGSAQVVVCSESLEQRLVLNDSCFECHMPRRDLDLSSHASQTDHRVLRKPGASIASDTTAPGDFRFFDEVSDSIPEESRRRVKAIYQVRNQGPSPMLYRELRSLVGEFPNDGMTQLSFGVTAMAQNDVRGAWEAWDQAAEHVESQEFALEVLVQLSQRSGAWDKARQYAQRLTLVNPYHATAHTQLAQALLVLGELDQAIVAATRAVELDPLERQGYQALVDAYRRKGEVGQSAQWQAKLDRLADKLQQGR